MLDVATRLEVAFGSRVARLNLVVCLGLACFDAKDSSSLSLITITSSAASVKLTSTLLDPRPLPRPRVLVPLAVAFTLPRPRARPRVGVGCTSSTNGFSSTTLSSACERYSLKILATNSNAS